MTGPNPPDHRNHGADVLERVSAGAGIIAHPARVPRAIARAAGRMSSALSCDAVSAVTANG